MLYIYKKYRPGSAETPAPLGRSLDRCALVWQTVG